MEFCVFRSPSKSTHISKLCGIRLLTWSLHSCKWQLLAIDIVWDVETRITAAIREVCMYVCMCGKPACSKKKQRPFSFLTALGVRKNQWPSPATVIHDHLLHRNDLIRFPLMVPQRSGMIWYQVTVKMSLTNMSKTEELEKWMAIIHLKIPKSWVEIWLEIQLKLSPE